MTAYIGRNPKIQLSMLTGMASRMCEQVDLLESGIRSGELDPDKMEVNQYMMIRQASSDFKRKFLDIQSAMYSIYSTLLEINSTCKINEKECGE